MAMTTCAWCGKFIGSKPPLDDLGISHGICPACFDALERERIVLSRHSQAHNLEVAGANPAGGNPQRGAARR